MGFAQGLLRAAVALDGDHRLEATEGHLLVAGGGVALPADARVAGVVVVLGGALALDGTVVGDVFHLGGDLELTSGARVEGRLVAAGGELRVAPGATVVGGVIRDLEAASELVRPAPSLGQRLARLAVQIALLAFFALAMARWAPRTLDRTSEALAHHPVVAVAMGALSGLVGLVLLVAMVTTVVLIPVALVGGVGFAVAIGFGWLAWGTLIGRALQRRGWVPGRAPALAIGTAAYAVAQGAVGAVPWIGGTLALLASVAALGAVVLTGFGVRRFVPDGP
ncbi:MAG: hypothetical protein ABR510_05915 [Trueperaceae bacterium]